MKKPSSMMKKVVVFVVSNVVWSVLCSVVPSITRGYYLQIIFISSQAPLALQNINWNFYFKSSISHAVQELKLQELQAQELSKKIAADKAKLKQKQTLYESVRSDRNLYSKQLVDSQVRAHTYPIWITTQHFCFSVECLNHTWRLYRRRSML